MPAESTETLLTFKRGASAPRGKAAAAAPKAAAAKTKAAAAPKAAAPKAAAPKAAAGGAGAGRGAKTRGRSGGRRLQMRIDLWQGISHIVLRASAVKNPKVTAPRTVYPFLRGSLSGTLNA